MAAATPTPGSKPDRTSNPVGSFLISMVVVALAMGSLWVGLSELTDPSQPGGTLRALGGVAGFFVVFGLTLAAAARQK